MIISYRQAVIWSLQRILYSLLTKLHAKKMAGFEDLFDGNNDEEITINTTYANKYKKFKECQELDKCNIKALKLYLTVSQSINYCSYF